ncbi:SPOR domain-containing protein [Pelagovum pacificum]|uniref:SPOR domain-containing protein n=1 Tax=Pelagovum pacificum TaxID=2588711 RepID=A0A5C5GBY7_9RHOB|nr:SPOR domain-containing protein [Pelagovum pacificum]QQA42018.1 SPOR domain-containing protein [Pelagovum pacificum]TNY31109.1 SPOR domain-containing protein [Pelagovum pacificum]
MTGTRFTATGFTRYGLVLAAGLTLVGCGENGQLNMPFFPTRSGDSLDGSASSGSVQLVERDVEAPEVFQVTEAGLWDGRPSLGGVWVAHPDVDEPERVIIRNRSNGQFVIGALFRRERDNPGPELQISSDAAEALGVLAGAPTELNVTALRREEGAGGADAATLSAAPSGAEGALDAPSSVETMALDPIANASAAIDAGEASQAGTVEVAAAPPAPEPAPPAPAPAPATSSSLEKPYIQIGIFSIEENADGTADRMRNAGIVPTVLAQESQGRAFWRVVVGPARDTAERAELLEKVKAQGFADAYAVTN